MQLYNVQQYVCMYVCMYILLVCLLSINNISILRRSLRALICESVKRILLLKNRMFSRSHYTKNVCKKNTIIRYQLATSYLYFISSSSLAVLLEHGARLCLCAWWQPLQELGRRKKLLTVLDHPHPYIAIAIYVVCSYTYSIWIYVQAIGRLQLDYLTVYMYIQLASIHHIITCIHTSDIHIIFAGGFFF